MFHRHKWQLLEKERTPLGNYFGIIKFVCDCGEIKRVRCPEGTNGD